MFDRLEVLEALILSLFPNYTLCEICRMLRLLCTTVTFLFSINDFVHVYHQITVNTYDILKTAVISPFEAFVFLSKPFGLRNAANTFQRFNDDVVHILDCVIAYIDDLINNSAPDQHFQH